MSAVLPRRTAQGMPGPTALPTTLQPEKGPAAAARVRRASADGAWLTPPEDWPCGGAPVRSRR
jgi:hypothetical protein